LPTDQGDLPGTTEQGADGIEDPDAPIPCTANEDCDDGLRCTENWCDENGFCAQIPSWCNDGNPCTDDASHPIKGCVFTPHERECEDGLYCTYPDKCSDGQCVPGPPAPCRSWTPCEVGTCNEMFDRCEKGGFRCKHVTDKLAECFPPPP
jgi:hypothetical protein